MSRFSDLQIGKQAEREFATHLLQCNNLTSIEFPTGKFKDWDIKATYDDKVITYEIKSDLKAEETGNVAIEKKYNGKASGIYVSKADYIVYHILGKRYIQERGELILRLINCEKRETKGGDGFKSDLMLVKLSDMETLFDVLREDDNSKTL